MEEFMMSHISSKRRKITSSICNYVIDLPLDIQENISEKIKDLNDIETSSSKILFNKVIQEYNSKRNNIFSYKYELREKIYEEHVRNPQRKLHNYLVINNYPECHDSEPMIETMKYDTTDLILKCSTIQCFES